MPSSLRAPAQARHDIERTKDARVKCMRKVRSYSVAKWFRP